MPRYRWTGVGPFDGDVEPGDVVDLPERAGEPQPEMVRVEEDAPETCDVVKSDGEVCGRELPCRYHSDGED